MSTPQRRFAAWSVAIVAVCAVAWQGTVLQRAQDARKEAVQRWELAIDGSCNGMFDCIVEETGTNAWYSPHFLELLGVETLDTDLHEGFLPRIHPDDRERIEGLLEEAVKEKKQIRTEMQAKRSDGAYRWFMLTVNGTHNHVQRISGSIYDITDHKLANERAELMMLSAPEATIVCDADGKVVVFNPAAEEMFGFTADEILGKGIDGIVTPKYLKEHDEVFAEALERLREAPDNWEIRKADIRGGGVNKMGKVFPIRLCVRGIKYSGTIEFIARITYEGYPPSEEPESPLIAFPMPEFPPKPDIGRPLPTHRPWQQVSPR